MLMIKSALQREEHKKRTSKQFNYNHHIYWKTEFEISYHQLFVRWNFRPVGEKQYQMLFITDPFVKLQMPFHFNIGLLT